MRIKPEIKLYTFWVYPLLALLLVSFFYLFFRLYQVQIIDHDQYLVQANRQYISPDYSFNRGSIYFSNKNGDKVSAAILEDGYTLAIVPAEIVDAHKTWQQINNIIELDELFFLTKANEKSDLYKEIIKRVPYKIGNEIFALNLNGVRLTPVSWRTYPGDNKAAQVLGFLSYQQDILKAQYGLERYYNEILSRQPSVKPKNIFISFFTGNVEPAEQKENGDISLTLEPFVQDVLEKKITEVQTKYDSELTGGIIMNPQTGEIYAMAAVPSFDPNNFASSRVDFFANPLVERVYEMGSIIKPLTVAAALDSGVVNEFSLYYDTGCQTLNNKTFCNYDGRARGTVQIQEILSQSLNTGVSWLVSQLGRDRFRQYFYDFGINSETGIDLPNEATPLVSNLQVKRDLEYAQASFGQGIAISPIQTIRALAALGNGGKLVQPHLLKEIIYTNGETKKPYYPNTQILKQNSSDTITRMLIRVVDTALLGGEIKHDRYTIAAKTGTAQLAGKGGYNQDDYLHSFFGYFPATNPQFIIFLYTVKPKGVDYASHTLTYPFNDLVDYLISYYQIQPDR